MRAVPKPLLVAAGVVALTGSLLGPGAQAEPARTAAQLEAELTAAHQRTSALYLQAAAASERYNGARVALTQAKEEVAATERRLRRAEAQQRTASDAVAALTVQDLQSGTSMNRWTVLAHGDDPTTLLDRETAYDSAQDALAARLDRLEAGDAVLATERDGHRAAVTAQREALARQTSARSAILTALADAQQAESDAAGRRDALLRELAEKRRQSLAEARRAQERREAAADSGRSTPIGGPSREASSEPAPGPTRRPSTPRPTPTTRPPSPPSTPDPPSPGSPSSSRVEKAIAFAQAQLGEPYVWGGAGPDEWDCSGLTMRAYEAAGVSIPHYGGSQYDVTTHVPVSQIRRGDLLFWSNGSSSSIYHVALYLGGGKMIQAPRPGRGVEIVPVSYWIRPDLASRPTA